MNFFEYVDRQKKLIRARHEGEEYFYFGDDEYRIGDSARLLSELQNLKGLNKKERLKQTV